MTKKKSKSAEKVDSRNPPLIHNGCPHNSHDMTCNTCGWNHYDLIYGFGPRAPWTHSKE